VHGATIKIKKWQPFHSFKRSCAFVSFIVIPDQLNAWSWII